jgi:hypothetical protein
MVWAGTTSHIVSTYPGMYPITSLLGVGSRSVYFTFSFGKLSEGGWHFSCRTPSDSLPTVSSEGYLYDQYILAGGWITISLFHF